MGKPANFEKVVSAMERLVRHRGRITTRGQLAKFQDYEDEIIEIASVMMEDEFFKQHFSFEDINLTISGFLVIHPQSFYKRMTRKNIGKFLEDYFIQSPTLNYFCFPAIILGFPEVYKVGSCEIQSYSTLPRQMQREIRLEGTPQRRRRINRQYQYLTTEVSNVIGNEKVFEVAQKRADQAFNILTCLFTFRPLLLDFTSQRGCYWISSDGNSRAYESRQMWQCKYSDEKNGLVQIVNEWIRNSVTHEVATRCLTAIDLYGTAFRTARLELQFLLVIIAMETLLLGRKDGTVSSGLREKIVLLLGNSPVKFEEFLDARKVGHPQDTVTGRQTFEGKIRKMYDKRSRFTHEGSALSKGRAINPSDLDFASTLFKFTLQEILNLHSGKGIDHINEKFENDDRALNHHIGFHPPVSKPQT